MSKRRKMLAAVVMIIGWPIVIYLATRESDADQIAREGGEAVATIVALEDQHETLHDHRPLMRVTVQGVREGSPFRATTDRRIDDDELESFVVGAEVTIRYDRESPDNIVILGVSPGADGS